MRPGQYNIRFPATDPHRLDQDEAYFYVRDAEGETRLRFHDYAEIYRRPGLYEQLFYQRLKCTSPQKICGILEEVLRDNHVEMSELRVLDLGAGNGMVGQLLQTARVVGVDICRDAYEACERDRPDAYDAYYVADLGKLDPGTRQELEHWQLDCLTCVAALGFGDIPTDAFVTAFNLVKPGAWIGFNIKETFLQENDASGFSRLVKHLLVTDTLEVHHLERYRHRISIDGRPLYYYAIVGRKEADVPSAVMRAFAA